MSNYLYHIIVFMLVIVVPHSVNTTTQTRYNLPIAKIPTINCSINIPININGVVSIVLFLYIKIGSHLGKLSPKYSQYTPQSSPSCNRFLCVFSKGVYFSLKCSFLTMSCISHCSTVCIYIPDSEVHGSNMEANWVQVLYVISVTKFVRDFPPLYIWLGQSQSITTHCRWTRSGIYSFSFILIHTCIII